MVATTLVEVAPGHAWAVVGVGEFSRFSKKDMWSWMGLKMGLEKKETTSDESIL